MGIAGRGAAVGVCIVFPRPGQIQDEELGHEIDRVRDDRRGDDDEEGLSSSLPADADVAPEQFEPHPCDDVRNEGHCGHQRHDDDVPMAEVSNLVRKDRADLVLVQALQEAGRDHEFRGRDRPAEDERIRRGVFALPDLRRGDPRLAREFVDGPEEPRIRIRGDRLAAANRPAHDRGRDKPLGEDEEERQAEDDRESGRERPALEDVIDDDEDREQEQGQEGKEEQDREPAPASKGPEASHKMAIFDQAMSIPSACRSSSNRSAARSAVGL